MASSFRRRQQHQQRSSSLPAIGGLTLAGTKPWTGGITLTSVGLRDLDVILGGGQPLGTCILLEQDRWTNDLALCLTKYWCAEAISQGHTLLIPSTAHNHDVDLESPPLTNDNDSNGRDGNDCSPVMPAVQGVTATEVEALLRSLPRNLHWDKQENKKHSTESDANARVSRPLDILKEEDEQSEEGLEIAWQYRKSVQKQRLGRGMMATSRATDESANTSNVFCHSYDLSGRMKDQQKQEESESVAVFNGFCCDAAACNQERSCGYKLYQCWVAQLKQSLTKSPNQVVRLLLYQAPIRSTSVALPLLLAHVRTHQLHVVVLVTTQSWTILQTQGLISLRRASDVVLQAEGFASRAYFPPPPEFRHLHGLLILPKASTVTAATANGSGGGHFADLSVSKRPPAHVYGLKRDRRKLHIPLLHIPPEDYAGGGGSVGGGGVRSGAGRPQPKDAVESGCGGGGGGGASSASPLDF